MELTERDHRLATDRNVWLATLRADGTAHVTPVWFTWVDDAFWMCTSSSSVKARNLRRDPRLSVALEDGDQPIVAEGSALLHGRPFPDRVVDAFAQKFGWDIAVPGTDGDWAVLIQLPVSRWLLGGPAQPPGPS